ncbi:MAG TPA: TonB-dependent receptor, partial [Bacteroidales bacterium]|nr:TonB-dependent receptor [Bacteroidales bacterium]
FSVAGVLANDSYSQTKTLNLNMNEATVKEVLSSIEEQSEFYFLFSENLVDVKRKVNVNLENQTIETALNLLFDGTDVQYSNRDRIFVLTTPEVSGDELLVPQQRTVSGTVTDKSGKPLQGVTVVVKGTTHGTITNADGEFSLTNIPDDAILQFSFVGMRTQEIPIEGRTTITVEMEEETVGIDEVVVVGYGSQRKSDITGSVASIPDNRLEQVSNNNFAEAIQGSVPGVNIQTTSSGAEGDDINILIRGRNSFSQGRNTPLIVLDGVPYNGNLSELNTTDIASIEVLKDASSAAIYGSRAANGVILITSKKGKKGKIQFNYDGLIGIETFGDYPKPMTPSEFYEFKRIRDESLLTNSEIEIYENGGGTDWLDLATRTGSRQHHTLSASGGNENIDFYISGSLLDVEGIAINDQFQRASVRINLDLDLTDWLTMGTNTQLSRADRDGRPVNFGSAFRANPLTTAYNEDGSLKMDPWPEDVQTSNPLDRLLYKDNYDTYKVFTNNYLNVELPFVEGLSYRLNTGIEYTNLNRQNYMGRDTKNGYRDQGRLELTDNVSTNYLVENIVKYDREFGKHTLGLTGLYSYQSITRDVRRLNARGFPGDELTWYQASSAAVIEPGYSYSDQTTLSNMLRINYNYDNRYLLTLTGRRDGYSGFGENQKWGNFYSGAAGWNAHNEVFLEDFIFDELKLRVSYGLNGNQAIGPYETLTTLNERPYLNGSSTAPGFVPDDIGNPNLRWESTLMGNIAIDYALFKNRLNGTIEYYESKTNDLLLSKTISPVSGDGNNAMTDNIGEIKNSGIEVLISGDIIRKTDFKINMTANFAYNKNEITKLYGNGMDDLANKWFIGEPINVAFDHEFGGVFQIGDDIENSAQPNHEPGFSKIVDQNGDGVIDDEDRTILGNEDPNIFAGLNFSIKYKGISLNIFSQGSFGAIKENDLLAENVSSDIGNNTMAKNWWTPDNPTNEFYANNVYANVPNVDIYQSVDYWRLKDITLSYDIGRHLGDLGIDNLQIYLTGRNLLTITGYEGLDPELRSDRDIPLTISYVFGLNLSF